MTCGDYVALIAGLANESLDPKLVPHMGFPLDWKSRPIWREILIKKIAI
jgi:hypothetical protein